MDVVVKIKPDDRHVLDVAEAAAERWEGPAESSGHRLSAGGDGAPVVAATDADLAVILDNLVENALNYSPGGTAVAIEWGAITSRKAPAYRVSARDS